MKLEISSWIETHHFQIFACDILLDFSDTFCVVRFFLHGLAMAQTSNMWPKMAFLGICWVSTEFLVSFIKFVRQKHN